MNVILEWNSTKLTLTLFLHLYILVLDGGELLNRWWKMVPDQHTYPKANMCKDLLANRSNYATWSNASYGCPTFFSSQCCCVWDLRGMESSNPWVYYTATLLTISKNYMWQISHERTWHIHKVLRGATLVHFNTN